MKKIKQYKGIIIIVLVFILGAFYWFQLRPTQIIKKCAKAENLAGISVPIPEQLYKDCLRKNGLEK